MRRLAKSVLAVALLLSAAVCWRIALAAPALKVLARITPEAGAIADAGMIDDEHLALLYPEAGHIADYTLDGQLYQHLCRESGMGHSFKPTACSAYSNEGLAVFDEAERQVFYFNPDGNIARGIDLAYPLGAGPEAIALSVVGDLQYGADKTLWVTMPERNVIASFSSSGTFKQQLLLGSILPYPDAVYTRGQVLPSGALYFLDYHQGAVIYREPQEENFHRLQLGVPEGLEAAAMVQDFAVDEQGNALVVTSIEAKPVVLLTKSADGYNLHTVDLQLPAAPGRLACRYSRGRFILWLREKPFVILLELR